VIEKIRLDDHCGKNDLVNSPNSDAAVLSPASKFHPQKATSVPSVRPELLNSFARHKKAIADLHLRPRIFLLSAAGASIGRRESLFDFNV
jgi:hypothetical protein